MGTVTCGDGRAGMNVAGRWGWDGAMLKLVVGWE